MTLSPIKPPPRPRPAALLDLTPDWLLWVADNRLWDCAPASMLDTMVTAGQDVETSAAAIGQIEQDPVFQAARRQQQMLRKLESVCANLQKSGSRTPAMPSSRSAAASGGTSSSNATSMAAAPSC